jgi:cytoskeletal protein CcmA (bactofilin family)
MTLFNRDNSTDRTEMAKETNGAQPARETTGTAAVSIIGPGMRVVGDCETEGTLRIEGIVEGTVRAGKAVVIGKDGAILGDLLTQDAIIGGKVTGIVIAESRLELQATCLIEGEIRARRIKLDEGGRINGKVHTGEVKAPAPEKKREAVPNVAVTAIPVQHPRAQSLT